MLGAALLFALAACDRITSSKLHGVDLSSMELPVTLHLRDTNGSLQTLEDCRGKIVRR